MGVERVGEGGYRVLGWMVAESDTITRKQGGTMVACDTTPHCMDQSRSHRAKVGCDGDSELLSPRPPPLSSESVQSWSRLSSYSLSLLT